MAKGTGTTVVVRFDLLADLDDVPEGATVTFDECDDLGAANLRGTGYAARDVELHALSSNIGGVQHTAEVNVSGLAGFLLAKIAAAYARRKSKDWYDIAFVLLHNDIGGPEAAAATVLDRFGNDLIGPIRTAIDDLRANSAAVGAQGPAAYVDQMLLDHPDLDRGTLAADAAVAVLGFCESVLQ